MNKLFKDFAALLLLFLLSFSVSHAKDAGGEMPASDMKKPLSEGMKIIEQMKFPPINFKVPEIGKEVEKVMLDNGMILYLKEDHRAPVINISGVIRTGEAYEKKSQYGVARLTGEVMRNGGTRYLSPEELNDSLDVMAAKLETGIEEEKGTISMEIISSQLEAGFDLFSEVLRYPAFDSRELELAKSQLKEELKRRNDNSSSVGFLEFNKIIYPDYCEGWEYDWQVVNKITRDDLVKWHSRFYHPNNMMFAVAGDFKKDEIIVLFNKKFGDWEKKDIDFSGLQDNELKFNPGLYYAVKDVDQSFILFGHLGVRRDNPDRYAIEVMNFILGRGGFNSYLMEKVRSDEGLAYSVGSFFQLNERVYGAAGSYCWTKSATTVKALKLMIDQFRRIQNEKVSPDKLKWAKDSIINSYLFKFEKPIDQAVILMMLDYDGMPGDYYKTYAQKINAVTADEVMRVAKKYLSPENFTIVVVCNPEELGEPLTKIGTPREIKLTEFNEGEVEK